MTGSAAGHRSLAGARVLGARRWVRAHGGPGSVDRRQRDEGAWARTFWSELVWHTPDEGDYVHYMSGVEDARIRAAYGEDKYRRLAALKARFGPENVFHLNPDIRPAR